VIRKTETAARLSL